PPKLKKWFNSYSYTKAGLKIKPQIVHFFQKKEVNRIPLHQPLWLPWSIQLLHLDKASVEDFSSNLTDGHPYPPLRLPHEFA
ncbi:MAG: hypothetical protein QF457_12675, partial [SAR324 cluster bacterium]|nr:hypothetical protein [SAR324 cluster bacterium]